jgi:hypothetical protein
MSHQLPAWVICALYKNKYRIFKPVELTIRKKTMVKKGKMEGMNQFRI